MKIGDKVSFLSDTGGGTVAGFQGKNIVLVEDADGFQIPTPINEVVVVGNTDYSTAKVVAAKHEPAAATGDGKSIKALMKEGQDELVDMTVEDEVDISKEITFHAPAEERKGGNQLTCHLAFVPIDIKAMTTTRFEVYIVNDSNYYLHYAYMSAEGASWTLLSHGEVEPNTKLYVEEIGREDLNGMLKLGFQLQAYKIDKPFAIKPMVESQFRLDPVKFYKLHTFQQTPFFDTPALLYTIVENDNVARPMAVDANKLKSEMYAKPEATKAKTDDGYVRRYDNGKSGNPFKIKHRGDEDTLVVDLHINALIDTTAGMSHADILNYQLKKFKEVLEEHKSAKGKKIVFIHGKGEGVLRHAIVNALNYQYKRYTYQDASFQEYGYGATQVTIK